MNMRIDNKKDGKYFFTEHAKMKMKFYGISVQRVHRVIRAPQRIEEGIVEKTIAAMQPTSTKIKDGKKIWSGEIWCMYQLRGGVISKSQFPISNKIQNSKFNPPAGGLNSANQQIRIISVWRYPGISPERDPVPEDILREIQEEVL